MSGFDADQRRRTAIWAKELSREKRRERRAANLAILYLAVILFGGIAVLVCIALISWLTR
jgi:hypothetical protein